MPSGDRAEGSSRGRSHNGSSLAGRPDAAQRAASEVHVSQYLGGQSDVENLRVALERNWSTSNINNGLPQSTANNIPSANAAQFHQSWSTGFSEITSPWPAVTFDGAGPRRSSTGTVGARANRSTSIDGNDTAGGPSSSMHDAARLKDWKRVIDICREDPEAASYIGPGGMTALHHICDKRCPDDKVAEAVIRACPDALTTDSAKGWTPLHYAGRFKCPPGVFRALLTIYPEKGKITVSRPDRQRRTPLFYAVRYDAPEGVVPQLLRADPSVVLSGDQNLQSPLEVIWDDFAGKIEGRRLLHPFVGVTDDERQLPAELQDLLQTPQYAELLKNWITANTFLKAAFGFPLSREEEEADTSGRKWRILHATAAVKCHISLFQMACALHPEQAQEMDENDLHGFVGKNSKSGKQRQTALHLAASSDQTGMIGRQILDKLITLNPGAASFADEIDGSLPFHRMAGNQEKSQWRVDGFVSLWEANLAAVRSADNFGRLPLHRAAAITELRETVPLADNIIANLVPLHPAAASVQDVNGSMPLHLLAMHGATWADEVQSVYEAYEGAVSVRAGRNLHNALPIHLAAANPKAEKSFIEELVRLHPRGVSQINGQGKLAFHLACELGKHWTDSATECIYNAFTQAVSTREENERHWTALHMASFSNIDCGDLIKKLVQLYPEACEIADSQGQLPLHLACKSRKNWNGGLAVLFEGNPIALGSFDQQGRLPLFIAADENIVTVSNAVPAATEDLDSAEAHRASSKQADELDELDVLFNLVRSDPTCLPERP